MSNRDIVNAFSDNCGTHAWVRDRLGISASTVQKLVRSGHLTRLGLPGSAAFYYRTEVEAIRAAESTVPQLATA